MKWVDSPVHVKEMKKKKVKKVVREGEKDGRMIVREREIDREGRVNEGESETEIWVSSEQERDDKRGVSEWEGVFMWNSVGVRGMIAAGGVA